MFQELSISDVSIFLIVNQSNQSDTFLSMNIIIADISKLAIKTREQSFYYYLWLDFTPVLEDRNNGWGAII